MEGGVSIFSTIFRIKNEKSIFLVFRDFWCSLLHWFEKSITQVTMTGFCEKDVLLAIIFLDTQSAEKIKLNRKFYLLGFGRALHRKVWSAFIKKDVLPALNMPKSMFIDNIYTFLHGDGRPNILFTKWDNRYLWKDFPQPMKMTE